MSRLDGKWSSSMVTARICSVEDLGGRMPWCTGGFTFSHSVMAQKTATGEHSHMETGKPGSTHHCQKEKNPHILQFVYLTLKLI